MKAIRWLPSIICLVVAILIIADSLRLGIGKPSAPGPGFVGFWACILLLFLFVIGIIQEKVSMNTVHVESIYVVDKDVLFHQLILVGALCVVALLLEGLGFILSFFILLWIMLLMGNVKRWFRYMIIAFLLSNVSYIVFAKLLRVSLPMGIFYY